MIIVLVMKSSGQIGLQTHWSVNECASPSGVQDNSIFVNWTPRDFFSHQGKFHYYSFFHLLNEKCKGELFKWQSPNNRIFPSIPCISFPPQYTIIRLIDLLPSSWANCCSIISIDAQGSGEPWSKWNMRVWVRSTVIYGSLSCVLTRERCDLVAADFLVESCSFRREKGWWQTQPVIPIRQKNLKRHRVISNKATMKHFRFLKWWYCLGLSDSGVCVVGSIEEWGTILTSPPVVNEKNIKCQKSDFQCNSYPKLDLTFF